MYHSFRINTAEGIDVYLKTAAVDSSVSRDTTRMCSNSLLNEIQEKLGAYGSRYQASKTRTGDTDSRRLEMWLAPPAGVRGLVSRIRGILSSPEPSPWKRQCEETVAYRSSIKSHPPPRRT